MKLPDERCRKAENADIQYDIGHATQDVHDWVIRSRYADDPAAPKRPHLEKGSEEERTQPGDRHRKHDFNDERKPGSRKKFGRKNTALKA